MAIDLGDMPKGTPPTPQQQAQIRSSIGLGSSGSAGFSSLVLTGQSITGTAANSLLDLATTWNTSGIPSAIKLNVNDVFSSPSSNLLDLQLNAISRFKITKTGAMDFGPSNTPNQRSVINSGTGQLVIFARGDVPTQAYAGAGLYNGQFAGLFLGNSLALQWSTGSFADGGSYDLFLTRRAAANIRLGNTDVAAPIAQTISVQSVIAGTTNTAGTNLTIAGSQGTGTGAGGSVIFQVAPAGSSGSAQNALLAALTIDSDRNITIGG
jgi:hypothetical protein